MTKIHASQALVEGQWQNEVGILIGDDGRIASVGAATGPADHALGLVLPAPVNLHSHAFQRAMAGLTERRGPDPQDSFWTWRRLMYRFLDRLTPDMIEAIAAQVFVEMAEAGYAAVAEFHYLHHGAAGTPYADIAELSARIAAAAQDTGFGLTHLPVFYQFGGCDRRELAGGQRRFGNDFDRFARLHEAAARIIAAGPEDWAIGVAPHSLRAVDPDGLAAAVRLAGDGPLHMHLTEQVAEVEEVDAHLGARPVTWLLDNADVTPAWCLIHCTQMTDVETAALARTGAVAGLCPITESSLGDGIFNGTDYRNAGGVFGVGSDSNIHIALFDELKTLDYSQRLRDRSRAALTTPDRSSGRVLFDQAVAGGAQAAGRGSGAIAPGRLADLVGLATDNAWVCNRQGDTALDSLIFGGHGQRCIRDVWSAGRHVVRDGRHVAREAVAQRFMHTVAALGQEV